MLEAVQDVWWPQICAEICAMTEYCPTCVSAAESREEKDEPLEVNGVQLSSSSLNNCPMGETWFIKQATRKSNLASQFILKLLKEQDVVEAKPTTPKAKTIRRGENVTLKNVEIKLEL